MIVINAKFLSQKLTGVHRYAIELCQHLPSEIEGHEIVLLGPQNANSVQELQHLRLEKIGHLKGNWWEQIELPLYLRKNQNPLLLNFTGLSPFVYQNKCVFIHDLSFKHHPEWFSKKFSTAYNYLMPKVAHSAKLIGTVSQYSKNDLMESYDIVSEKIEVIYAAASNQFQNLHLPKEDFVLMVSSLDPRKNMKRAIEAFLQIETDWKLVIIGDKMKSFSNPELEKFIDHQRIIFTGYLSDDELVYYYNKAKIFLYPSLFEGFGIPPMEAQKCGTPAIVSEVTCLPEIYGNSVLYCNPYSLDSIKNTLQLLMTDETLQQGLVIKGHQNADRFSWKQSARILLEKTTNI